MAPFKIYALIGVVGLGIAGAVYSLWPEEVVPASKQTVTVPAPDIRTVTPTISKNFSTLLLAGTVQSYETAKIATRSEGIISDIYAEVGDRITAGQTLATLLPHGVEGQASADIAEARALRDAAKANYDNAVRIAASTRNRSETAFDTTKSSQTAAVAFMEKSVLTAGTAITSAESALTRALAIRDAKLAEADNAIAQAADQAVIASSSAYETVAADIVIDRSVTAQSIATSQLASSFGALDTSAKQTFVDSFNRATTKKTQNAVLDVNGQRANVPALIATMAQLLADSEVLLRKSVPSSDLSQAMLDDKLKNIHTAQKELLTARQEYNAAINNQKVTQKDQDAEVAKMESDLKEKQAILAESQSSLALAKQGQQKETQMAQKDLQATATEKDSDVTKMRAELVAAEAALTAKLTGSGHAVIKAVAAGVIAKRLINVGDAVMANQPVFEIVDVNTTLARKNKVAIQFGAPEELFDVITEQSPVEIVVPGQGAESYRAVVTRKGAQIDPASRTFTLLALLTDDTILPPNSNVRVRVAAEKDPAWAIPARAIKRMDGMNHVWVMQDGKPQQITLEVLAEDGEFADVKSSELTADTTIVIDPPESFLMADTAGNNSTSAAPTAGHAH